MLKRGAKVVACLVLGLSVQAYAWAQPLASVSRTQCKQWDNTYISAFQTALIVSGVATLFLALLAGFAGRWSWIAAAPRQRILVVAFLVALLVELGIVILPWTLGFGWLWFSTIDTAYFDCIPISFGAEGLISGLIGSGIAAVAQWPTITYLLLAPVTVAGLLAWLITEIFARAFRLRRLARREGV